MSTYFLYEACQRQFFYCDAINAKYIRSHWDEILRLAASIKQGTVQPP
jgi:TnpA family transposase